MSLNDLILETARADLGVVEWAQGSNPKVLAYYREAGHSEVKSDEVPWCAAFVNAILARCGLLGTGSLMARSFLTWGEDATADPQPGDIVVLSRGAPPSGHVGIFVGFVGDNVQLIGGNQGDSVSIASYSRGRVIGVRRAKAPREAVTQTRTYRSAAATGAGLAGTTAVDAVQQALTDAQGQVSTLIPYLDTMRWVFIALAIAGVALTLYRRAKDFDAGRK